MGNPQILGSRRPLTLCPIDLKFHRGDYVGDMKPQAQNGINRPGRAGPAKGWNVKVNLGLFFYFFYRISCPPLEITILHGSTPFLRQITCFGGDWFSGGLVVRVKIFPLLKPPKPQIFVPFLDRNFRPKRFTIGTLQSKLPLIIIVAPLKVV